jgi:hypothetical protein
MDCIALAANTHTNTRHALVLPGDHPNTHDDNEKILCRRR